MANNHRQTGKNDVQDLENAFHKLSDKSKSKRKKGSNPYMPYITIGICILVIGILIGGILVISSLSPKGPSDNDVIENPVSVDGLDLHNKNYKEAKDAIGELFAEKYEKKDFSVKLDDLDISIPYSVSKVTLDIDTLLGIISDHKGENDLNLNLTDYISVNQDAIKKLINDLLPSLNLSLVPTEYEITGTAPESYDAIDENISMSLKITKGTPGKTVDVESLTQQVVDCILQENWSLQFQSVLSNPEELDWEAIRTAETVLPVEAAFEEKTFNVLGGTYGYSFDIAEVSKALEEAEFGQTVEVAFQWIEPETTAQELADTLFKDELASYSTHAGSNYNRNINLKLAAEAINGTILYPGDVFSYNGTLGERTPEKGYMPGASYVGGLTVMDYGGGICQVTSTLYYCTILADMEIVERECHGYASSYTPLSTDATVFWGGIDFKFKNNWNYPIRIDAYAEYGNVYVSLYGTDEKDYYVKFENEWLDTYPFETVYQEMPADNEKGYKDGDIIIDPYTGYKSRGYRARYDKETGELIEKVLESTDIYSSRNKVICKIITEEGEGGEGGEGGTGGENPDQGGTGSENPDQGGTGGENPDQGGSGSEDPDQGGSGGENPDQGGSGSEDPDQGDSGNETTEPGNGAIELPMISG